MPRSLEFCQLVSRAVNHTTWNIPRTWTRAMLYHPHLHCIVPAGGIDPEKDRWVSSRGKYLVPVRALSVLFRARFIKLVKRRLPDIEIPKSVWDKNWVVYAKPAVQGADRVLEYLGR